MSIVFTGLLKEHDIRISTDDRGRALDNIFVERLWRSVKYECIYLDKYYSVKEVYESLREYFQFYSQERLHQSPDYKTPAEVYSQKRCLLTKLMDEAGKVCL